MERPIPTASASQLSHLPHFVRSFPLVVLTCDVTHSRHSNKLKVKEGQDVFETKDVDSSSQVISFPTTEEVRVMSTFSLEMKLV